jgi:hypothetical protein
MADNPEYWQQQRFERLTADGHEPFAISHVARPNGGFSYVQGEILADEVAVSGLEPQHGRPRPGVGRGPRGAAQPGTVERGVGPGEGRLEPRRVRPAAGCRRHGHMVAEVRAVPQV